MLKRYNVLIEVDTEIITNVLESDEFDEQMVVGELGWCKDSGIAVIAVEELKTK